MTSTERRLKKDNPQWTIEEIELKAQEILDNYNFQFRKEIKKRNKKTMEAFERSLDREQIEWACIAAGNGD
ncbi:hypothetical protein OAF80_00400 [bacterium]|nr:hypothetical protein [bacterium]